MDKNKKSVLDKIPYNLDMYFINNDITEIRLRENCNILLKSIDKNIEIDDTLLSQSQIENIFMALCNYTLSSRETEISQGYITVDGGHRIGIGGQFYTGKKGVFLNRILSLNIRFNNQVKFDIDKDILSFKNGILIAGPPHSGKTTFLRNTIEKLDGNTVVCDERKELYTPYSNCDYISGIKKNIAIEQATRSLNPDYIVCDEIGSEEEAGQLLSCINTGVKIICTAHSDNLDKLKQKPNIYKLMCAGIFDKYILLNKTEGKFVIEEIRNV